MANTSKCIAILFAPSASNAKWDAGKIPKDRTSYSTSWATRSLRFRLGLLCWRVLTNANLVRDAFRVLVSPAYVKVWICNPRFCVKYLFEDYLARSFTPRQATACFVHHYRRLRSVFPDSLLRRMLSGDLVLHRVLYCGSLVALTIGLSRACDKEGELSLTLKIDDVAIFTLSFTIVPGWVVGIDATETILISRLQGAPGSYPHQIRFATGAFRGMQPRQVLVSAVEGIAMGLRIGKVTSVSSIRQSSFSEAYGEVFDKNYDGFLSAIGMKKLSLDFWGAEIPIRGKPLSGVKKRHRSTAKKRRAGKEQVQKACAEALRELIASTMLT